MRASHGKQVSASSGIFKGKQLWVSYGSRPVGKSRCGRAAGRVQEEKQQDIAHEQEL
ncbi:hypothetical protein [Desulfovibrio porci]|uniref:hypothetical protein n=1 Tax=Desulfovibrio porci TaxID=2605782 RepID=UPI0018A6B6F9|nr:hypothetical protein [Desulfovibrio porci]